MPELSKSANTVKNIFGRLVLFPFLLPLFFVLHIERYYLGAVSVKEAVELTALYVLLAAVIYWGVRLIFSGKPLLAGLGTFFAMILFLYWGEIIQAIIRTFHFRQNYSNHPIFLLVLVVLFSLLLGMVTRLKPQIKGLLQFYLNLVLVVYVVVEIALLLAYGIGGKLKPSLVNSKKMTLEDSIPLKKGKDIYLLIFDEYSASVSLRDDWQIDNKNIETFLTQKGFHIAKGSRSNYNLTQFSMASMLNMTYLKGYHSPQAIVGERDYQFTIPAIEDARVVNRLCQAGYSFSNYSIFGIRGIPGEQVNDLHVSGRRLITNNNFYKLLVEQYLPYLTYRNKIKANPRYYDPSFYRTDSYNKTNASAVIAKAKEQSNVPKFVLAHFLLPHPPFYYDSLGRLLPIDEIKKIQTMEDQIRGYQNNVGQANRVIMRLTATILKETDGNAMIIIIGDHGYRLKEKDFPVHSFPNFNALYFPDQDYSNIPDSMTNVNLFRLVFNTCCGGNYKLLPDSCITLKAQ